MKKFQVKTKWDEKPTKIKPQAYGVQFVLANYYYLWGLFWDVFDTPSDAPLGKTYFPFLCRYLLQTAPWLEVGPCVLFPLPQFSTWICSGLMYAATVSTSSGVNQSCYF